LWYNFAVKIQKNIAAEIYN